MKRISVIVVNYNSYKYLNSILHMLNMQSFLDFEMILVDNKSPNGDANLIRENFIEQSNYPWLKFYESDKNGGFAYGVNYGISKSCGEYLLIMNPDTEIISYEFLKTIFDKFLYENELYGGKLIAGYGDDGLSNELFTLDKYGYPCEDKTKMQNAYVYGCLMLTSRNNYKITGGMDSGFFMYFEETDWCMRSILMGYNVKMITIPAGMYLHEGGGSTGKGDAVPYIIQKSFYYNHLAMVYKNYQTSKLLYIYPGLLFYYLVDFLYAIMSIRLVKARAIIYALSASPAIFFKYQKQRKLNLSSFKHSTGYLIENYFSKSNPLSRKLLR